jgi:hypothetical protein
LPGDYSRATAARIAVDRRFRISGVLALLGAFGFWSADDTLALKAADIAIAWARTEIEVTKMAAKVTSRTTTSHDCSDRAQGPRFFDTSR